VSGRSRRRRDDRGVVIIIVALMITVLFLIVAIVVDLGATRSDRRGGQSAVDSAAASAGKTLADTGNAERACQDALDFAAVALEIDEFTGADCADLVGCAASVPDSVTGMSGQYTITVHHPVLDGSPLMTNSSSISNAGVAASDDDGEPCERMAVELRTTGDPFFGEIAGSTERTSTVHAVTRIEAGQGELRALNLLLLERTDCQALTLDGQGSVVVAAYTDPVTGFFKPGTVAVDSDGTTGCQGNKATLEAGGLSSSLVANGPCAANPAAECDGEGEIALIAPLTSGTCVGTGDTPACKENQGTIEPDASQSSERYTRAPVDHRFNCKALYTNEPWYVAPLNQEIPPCPSATGSTAYVDQVKALVATYPAGPPLWQVYGGSNPACNALSNQSNANRTFLGNVFINCDSYSPKGATNFVNGNVIFKGDVTISNGNTLNLHACTPTCTPLIDPFEFGDAVNVNLSSVLGGWVYVGGALGISGGGALDVNRAAVVIGPGGKVEATGGVVDWVAPEAGPFEDLAMWSEGTAEHGMAGGGNLYLEGTFFNGQSTFKYSGDALQELDEAQFIANKMVFSGQGRIVMQPAADRAVLFPSKPTSAIIR
jgi:Flp pilus assembly protein TadG